MTYYDERLRFLQERTVRNAHLKSKLVELEKQKKELTPKLKLWEIYAHNEQIDVDNLEGKTIISLFYRIVGKKDEKLDKERAEALKWALKRDEAKSDLEYINASIEACEVELATLNGCEIEYATALDEKLATIKKAGVKDPDHALALEERISYCDNQQKEVNDAIAIAESAGNIANETLSELYEAQSWGEVDMFSSGKIADMKKYDHLENAEILVKKLKKELSKLSTEIVDIAFEVSVDISLSEFSSTSDWIFDNIFTAWTVLDEIEASIRRMKETVEQIKQIETTLNKIKDDLMIDRARLQFERDSL